MLEVFLLGTIWKNEGLLQVLMELPKPMNSTFDTPWNVHPILRQTSAVSIPAEDRRFTAAHPVTLPAVCQLHKVTCFLRPLTKQLRLDHTCFHHFSSYVSLHNLSYNIKNFIYQDMISNLFFSSCSCFSRCDSPPAGSSCRGRSPVFGSRPEP